VSPEERTQDDVVLDRALARLPKPVPAGRLHEKILTDFSRQTGRNLGAWTRRWLDGIWPGVPLWQPIVALALSLAIGIGIGVFTPFDFLTPDESAMSLDAPSFILFRDG